MVMAVGSRVASWAPEPGPRQRRPSGPHKSAPTMRIVPNARACVGCVSCLGFGGGGRPGRPGKIREGRQRHGHEPVGVAQVVDADLDRSAT